MSLQTKTFSYGSLEYHSYSNAYVLDLILTEESTDALANTSVVSYKLQMRSGPNNRFNGEISASVTLNNSEVAKDSSITISAAYNKTYVLLTGTATITHNNDGSLAMPCVGAIKMVGETKTNPYAPPDLTASGTFDLTTIPRASSIAATSVNIEDTSTIIVNKKSTTYTHSIHYKFGSLSGYIANSVGNLGSAEVKLSEQTVLFPIPVSFYNQIPNSPSGICTLTCTTYSGNTKIGNPETATFTITADKSRCKPSIGGTVVDVNPSTLALTGNNKHIVYGVSNIKCSVDANAKNGATIKAIYINGSKIQTTPHTIYGASVSTITFRAEDSRGYIAEYAVPNLKMISYIPLSFNASATRTDPTSGAAVLSVKGTWFSGNFGAATNYLTAKYRINSGSWVPVTLTVNGENMSLSEQLNGLDYRYAYTVELQISDLLKTVTKTESVSKGTPVFDWGENDFSFNVPVSLTATDGTKFVIDLVNGQLIARVV